MFVVEWRESWWQKLCSTIQTNIHMWWLLLILKYNFQFLFIERLSSQSQIHAKWWILTSRRNVTHKTAVEGGLEIFLIFINIHCLYGMREISFENVKINMRNDLRFIIIRRPLIWKLWIYKCRKDACNLFTLLICVEKIRKILHFSALNYVEERRKSLISFYYTFAHQTAGKKVNPEKFVNFIYERENFNKRTFVVKFLPRNVKQKRTRRRSGKSRQVWQQLRKMWREKCWKEKLQNNIYMWWND